MAGMHAGRGSLPLVLAVCGFVAIGAIIAAASAWTFVGQRLGEYRDAALMEAVAVRAKGIEQNFSRELQQKWRTLKLIAEEMTGRDDPSIRASLDLVVGDTEKVSWAGIASVDATVSNASAGMLEGTDVSSRPWFRNGLHGDFAGEVHPAVLLADLLPPINNEPRRFLDMATPVLDETGAVQGVLGFHINHHWVEQYLRETAHVVGLDVYIIDRTGHVVVRTDGLESPIENLQSFRSAMTGAPQTGTERWPDGRTYFSTVIPALGYQDLPSFGWSLIARINNEAHPLTDFSGLFVTYFSVLGIVLAALTGLFIVIFIQPFRKLADCAKAVMRGEEIYPYESRTTSEARILSAAIARLQNKIQP